MTKELLAYVIGTTSVGFGIIYGASASPWWGAAAFLAGVGVHITIVLAKQAGREQEPRP